MPLTILIAEDDAKNNALMKDVLELKGYSVLVAANGREAVEKAGEALPQLILMDMQMPVMDGFEAVRLLKKDERNGLADKTLGIGSGLCIVKRMATLHGGRVWAESKGQDLGSRFTVALPLLN